MRNYLLLIILFSGVNCARILFFTYIPSISHQFVFRSIWKELSLRGHQVVAIATDPIGDSTLTNLTEIDVSVGYEMFRKFDYSNLSSSTMGPFGTVDSFAASYTEALNLEINTKEFQDLLKKPKDNFDLILVENHHLSAFGIQNKFRAPIIGISTMDCLSISYDLLGSPTHPFLYPDFSAEFKVYEYKWSLWPKLNRLYIAVGMWFKYRFQYFPEAEKEAERYFGKGEHHIEDIVRNIDLLMVHKSPIFSNRRPLTPNIIEFYNVHQEVSQRLTNVSFFEVKYLA